MQDIVLSIRGLELMYGSIVALKNINLDLKRGEFFALLGSSGCGKSTLLRSIAGFIKPSKGEILLNGKDIIDMSPRVRPINMMFQSYALFPSMTVRKNIAYGLEAKRLPKREIEAKVDRIISATHLGDFADRLPQQLSGGQRQRVALARALVMEPEIVLLDEPLGALDKKLREAMQIELKRLQNESGTTFIVVTHDQEEALSLADRIAVMKGGQIEQIGSPKELYSAPGTKFVADFIGSTNIFSQEAVSKLQHVPFLSTYLASSKPVSYSIRPENIGLEFSLAAGEPESLQGTVAYTIYRGGMVSVFIKCSSLNQEVRVDCPVKDLDPDNLTGGRQVYLRWNPADGVALDQ